VILGQPQAGLGWNPLSSVKKVATSAAKGVASGVKTAGKVVYKAHAIPTKYAVKATTTVAKGAATGAKAVGKVAYKGVEWTLIKPTLWLAEKAMAPVKSRVQKIVHRRAAKLAVDRRGAGAKPTPAEVQEARSWTRSKLRGELPHGPVLSVFADATPYDYMLGDYQLGVAPAVVAAAVPVLMAAVAAILNRYSSSGEAPANPQADAQANAVAPDAPMAPGEVDMTPVQEAAEEVQQATEEAVAAATGQKPPGRSMTLPGGMKVQRNHLLIGGAVIGALVLVMMMKPAGGKLSGARRFRRRRRRR
jgi:hypothetical protein